MHRYQLQRYCFLWCLPTELENQMLNSIHRWYLLDFDEIFQRLTITPFDRTHTTKLLSNMLTLKTEEEPPKGRKFVIEKLVNITAAQNKIHF